MSISRLRSVAVVVVSDTCFKDASSDQTGPRLRALIESSAYSDKFTISGVKIAPDEKKDIADVVTRLCDLEKVDLVITAGGTGFAKRDITPEAVKPLFEKDAPGLVHVMFAESLKITPLGAMARLAAGVRGGTIILCVPGSPKGATENVAAVLKLLPHASDLAKEAVISRQVHAKGTTSLEQQAGLVPGTPAPVLAASGGHMCGGHHHGRADRGAEHSSNDPAAGVTRRARASPYPMVSVEDALTMILTRAELLDTESLSVEDPELLGRTVAEDVKALESVPAFRASIVDGYAVCADTGPGTYPVVGASVAGSEPLTLTPGQVARITTGAPLPQGADEVIMVEDTRLVKTTNDGKEEEQIEILEGRATGNMVREAGSDIEVGQPLLSHGVQLSANGGEIGMLASAGCHEVKCYKSPTVGVLSTGDELVSPGDSRKLRVGEIRDSNRVSLLAAVTSRGYRAIDLGIARDQAGSLRDVLQQALEKCDVIITTGGVSMGELDLLKPTIERELSGSIHFGRVAMKPGKPTTFATVGRKLIFALPGNPASALVTFHLFVLPALRRMSGYSLQTASLPTIWVKLQSAVKLDPRPEYHRVQPSQRAGNDLLASARCSLVMHSSACRRKVRSVGSCQLVLWYRRF
ncbi:hypothetical protein PYCC9005_005906 [Savitreella phatthalungensis]